MKKLGKIISALLLIITFVFIVLLVVTRIQGNTPQLFGYQVLRVSSSSMEPVLQVGDIILSRKVADYSQLEIGDIITFKGTMGSYSGKLITHEIVVEPQMESDGKYYLQTMGVANYSPDPIISEDQVVGQMVCEVPVLSAVYDFFKTPFGLIVILLFLAILFINEAFRLFGLVKSKNNSDSIKNDADV